MAKRMRGNFKGEKRKKEIARVKKQEEKRQRRQSGGKTDSDAAIETEGTEVEGTEESQDVPPEETEDSD